MTIQIGIPGFEVEPGDHICAFYLGKQERDDVLLPFLRTGLHAGEKCLCIVDTTEPEDVLSSIGNELDVHGFIDSQQLEVRTPAAAYLRSGGFSMDEMLGFLRGTVARAIADGYGFVRVTGEASWLLGGPPGADEFLDYESELNRFAPQFPQAVLCLYDLERFGGGMIVELLKTHPKLLLGGLVLENPHFLSPDEYRAARS
ncbi:MAG: MEDS domain-containing protein [Solirubrobacteraceae bacterium]